MTAPATTFTLLEILLRLADQENVNLEVDGIEDEVYGLVITADKSFAQFLSQHKGPFNFQIVDGDPIRIIRRAIGDDLEIDYTINQTDCIARQGLPALQFQKTDPETIPGQIELQYIDPAREFTVTTQYANHRYRKQGAIQAAADLTAATGSSGRRE